MPRKATKAVPPRAASDRMRTVSKKVKANPAIDANYGNKRAKRPIIIENSSDNDSSDDDLEEPIRKKKPPPEPRLPSFLINATTFLGKECILHVSKFVNLHQWGASIYFRDSWAKLAEIANERDIEPVLLSSIAITSTKGMNHEDFIKNDVRASVDFLDVEGVLAHLDECRKKGIRVDLTVKYGIKKNVEDDVQEISDAESILPPLSSKKPERHVSFPF